MGPLIVALLQGITPLVLESIAAWQVRTGETRLPTEEELRADYNANREKYLREGLDWLAANPA